MRRGLGAFVILLWSVGLVFGAPTAKAAGGERYLSWDVSYEVRRDGSVDVTETLQYQFAGAKRGLIRWILTAQDYEPEPDKYRRYEMTNVSVYSPSGAPDDKKVTKEGAQTQIRIGDPDKRVRGVQTYVIEYTLAHVVNKNQDDPDATELYINATGNENDAPIEKFSATITGPGGVQKAACYQGRRGSDTPCQAAASGDKATFSASDLPRGDGVTIVGQMKTSMFSDTSPDLREGDPEDDGNPWSNPMDELLTPRNVAGGLGVPAVAAAVMGLLYLRKGRDERYVGQAAGLAPVDGQSHSTTRGGKQTVAVRFEPPENCPPGLMGTIFDQSADTVDISATVVDLAVRGQLTMEEIPKSGMFSSQDWRLRRTHSPVKLTPYERTVLNGLFEKGSEVLLSSLREEFHTSLSTAKSQLYTETVQRGWYRKSPQTTRNGYFGLGFLIVAAAVGLWFFLPSGPGTIAFPVGLGIAGVLVMGFGQAMPARTAKGSAVLAQTLGFKQYLATAEANQIRFEEAERIFSRYLPYAIVFDLTKEWANTFEQVARAAEAAGQTVTMPTWYISPYAMNFGAIAHGMDEFGTVAGTALSSTPSSSTSGSSGGSGFSGGFSGGGISGGGSSSW